MDDRVVRMVAEAQARIRDGDLLSQAINRASDSDALLRILGFEILLKAALLVAAKQPARHHRYTKLWRDLPVKAQDAIVSVASTRMPGHADLSKLDHLLDSYQFIFTRARYHYELYDGYSLEEQYELGELWKSLGSPTEESVVQYHPNELNCLIYGLEQFIHSAA